MADDLVDMPRLAVLSARDPPLRLGWMADSVHLLEGDGYMLIICSIYMVNLLMCGARSFLCPRLSPSLEAFSLPERDAYIYKYRGSLFGFLSARD